MCVSVCVCLCVHVCQREPQQVGELRYLWPDHMTIGQISVVSEPERVDIHHVRVMLSIIR